MSKELKNDIVERLRQAGSYDVRVANPRVGFEHGLPERHPVALWPQCSSIIVFAVAMSPKTNNVYAGPLAPYGVKRNSVDEHCMFGNALCRSSVDYCCGSSLVVKCSERV